LSFVIFSHAKTGLHIIYVEVVFQTLNFALIPVRGSSTSEFLVTGLNNFKIKF